MRVLFYLYFPAGGIGRYTHTLLEEMVQLDGIEIEVACLPEFKYRQNDSYATWPGLWSISSGFAPLRKLRFLLGQFINPRRLYRHAQEFRPDVIHFGNVNHLTFPLWQPLMEKSGAKIVLSAHDVRRSKAIISRRWENRQLQAFYRAADCVLVHSAAQKGDLIDFAQVDEEAVELVPHGPYSYPPTTRKREELRTKYELPESAKVGLCFGQIRDEKNLEETIRSLSSVPDAHLLVAGKNGAKHQGQEYYRNVAQRAGVAERIRFLDRFIPDDEVSDLFKMSDWSALTYSKRFTSQSGVLSSAVTYRKPVLVTPCATFTETLEEYDIGVSCGGEDADSIAVGMSELHARLDSGPTFDFETYLEKNSWLENARRTVKVYRRLLDQQGGQG